MVVRPPPTRAFGLLIAAAVGVSLAVVVWEAGLVRGEFVGDWQDEVAGAHSGPALALAMGIAFIVGASMVVLPCGFPAVFAVPTALERATGTGGRLRTLAAFSAGGIVPLALLGAVLGLLGGGLWEGLSTPDACKAFAAILYSVLGAIALAYALTEFGILRLQGALTRFTGPALPSESHGQRRALMLGATFGAGLGIACPMPTYYALLGWVAVAASPWYGGFVLAAYGAGRVLVPVVVGLAIVAGVSRRDVSRGLVRGHGSVQIASAMLMAALGVFLLSLFGGFVGLSTA